MLHSNDLQPKVGAARAVSPYTTTTYVDKKLFGFLFILSRIAGRWACSSR